MPGVDRIFILPIVRTPGESRVGSDHSPRRHPVLVLTMRDCPTTQGSSMPLIIHRITAEDCSSRQECHYHKCHRCIYRGKAASWEPEGNPVQAVGSHVAERAVPTKIVEIPRPEKSPAAPKSAPKKAPQRAAQPQAATSRKAGKAKASEAAG